MSKSKTGSPSTVVRNVFATVPISKLRLPGDMAERRKLPHVIALGESFAATGGQPGEPPIIDGNTFKIVSGRDRLAACLNLGLTHVDVFVMNGSPVDLERVTLVENVYRRNDPEERKRCLARLVELEQVKDDFPDVPDAPGSTPEPAKPGRPLSAKGEAIKAVAAETGVSESTVRSAASQPSKQKSEPLVIDSMGLDVPEEVRLSASLEVAPLQSMAQSLIRLQAELTALEGKVGHQFPILKATLHEAALWAKKSTPSCVCPYCKLIPIQPKCTACNGRGWLTVGQMEAVTDPLLLKKGPEAGVYCGGVFTVLSKATLK